MIALLKKSSTHMWVWTAKTDFFLPLIQSPEDSNVTNSYTHFYFRYGSVTHKMFNFYENVFLKCLLFLFFLSDSIFLWRILRENENRVLLNNIQIKSWMSQQGYLFQSTPSCVPRHLPYAGPNLTDAVHP